MAWIVRLVKTGAGSEKQSIDVATITRPDDLVEIANLGLTLAEGKRLLAALQQKIVAAQAGATLLGDRIAAAVARFVA